MSDTNLDPLVTYQDFKKLIRASGCTKVEKGAYEFFNKCLIKCLEKQVAHSILYADKYNLDTLDVNCAKNGIENTREYH